MERVSVITGSKDSNILLVCPHGADDIDTVECTKIMAATYCHAVINNGFERSKVVDVLNDKADCNSIEHVTLDEVVYEEFMKPIVNFCIKRNKKNNDPVFVYYIHGFGKQVSADVILGVGLGVKTDHLTMREFRIRVLYDYLDAAGLKVFLGKGGGKYAARQPDNLNQWFRQESFHQVETVQLELSAATRTNVQALANIASALRIAAQADNRQPGNKISSLPVI